MQSTTEKPTQAGQSSGLSVIAGSPLLEIAERLRTQDNRITQNPMFCVQQRVKIRGLHPRWSDNTEWILDGEVVEPETEGAEEYGYRHEWQTVMVAFTEEGCKEYLRQNSHNLREPRIYVESFNRCPEMIAIRDWLLSLENSQAQTGGEPPQQT